MLTAIGMMNYYEDNENNEFKSGYICDNSLSVVVNTVHQLVEIT